MRCGIRPLAVRRGFSKKAYPLELSRKHLIHGDRARQVVAVYGGKLTSCGLLAGQVRTLLAPYLQKLMDYPVVTAGIVLAPRGAGLMLAS